MDTKTSPLALLNDATLLKTDALIDGAWVAAPARFDVTDPATGRKLADVANCGAADADAAIAAANRAWPAWRAKTAKERAAILMQWFRLLHQHADDLARIMTAEQGKPLAEAKGEVVYGAVVCRGSETRLRRDDPDHRRGQALPRHQAAGRRVRGDHAVELPDRDDHAQGRAGAGRRLPGGHQAGRADAAVVVRHLSFTGSTEVGRILAAQCAPTIKKISLELGGNAPFIVFDDADLDSAVDGAMISKYRNAGQTCVCANRLYVQAGVYDAFVAKLAERSKSIKVGSGFETGVTQGPLIDDQAISKVEAHVADAVAKGATVVVGGTRAPGMGDRFYTPTVLANVTGEMLCAKEETFGPVAPVFRFATEQEAIELANATEFGLASYFYSRDVGRIFRVAEALEYGMVGINTGLISTAEVPFGGVKQSGLGREGSHHGIDDYVEIKYLCLGDLNK